MDIRNTFNSSLRAKILIRVLVVQVNRANRAGKAGGNIAPHTSSPSHNDNPHHNNPSSSLDPPASPRLLPEFSHSDWLLLAYKIKEIRPYFYITNVSNIFSQPERIMLRGYAHSINKT
jgi:hypothetical protein